MEFFLLSSLSVPCHISFNGRSDRSPQLRRQSTTNQRVQFKVQEGVHSHLSSAWEVAEDISHPTRRLYKHTNCIPTVQMHPQLASSLCYANHSCRQGGRRDKSVHAPDPPHTPLRKCNKAHSQGKPGGQKAATAAFRLTATFCIAQYHVTSCF
jgi:hypothetical protein